MKLALALLLAAGVAACGEKAATPDPNKLAATFSGADKGTDTAACRLFAPTELAALSGETMGAGHSAAAGLGCQWPASDGSGSAIVTVAPKDNYVETSEAPGYRALPDVGEKAFVAGEPGGWGAGAITGDKAVLVSIDSDKTSEANVVSLLKQAIAKAGH